MSGSISAPSRPASSESRARAPDEPTHVLFDLDPADGLPFAKVVEAALLVRDALPLADAEQKLATRLRVDVIETEASRDRMLALRGALERHPGDCPVLLHLRIPGESETVIALPDACAVAPSDAVLRAVNDLFGRRVAEWVH